MNIENHFLNAEAYLDMANEMVEAGDYIEARAALAKVYGHTRELIDRVQKVVVMKANVELSESEVQD